MIDSPFEMRKFCFFDYDGKIIGVMWLPKVILDATDYKEFFCMVNMIHPELRGGLVDPYATERKEKLERALRDWPRNRVYPEESWYLEMGENGLEIKHSLTYKPGEEIPKKGRLESFRPVKMKEDGE